MERAAFGDRQAFAALYDRYADALYRYFVRMLWHDEATAADLTQEVFLKVMQHSERFDANRSFKTWLYSVAHNLCKNQYRHMEVVKKAEAHLAHADAPGDNAAHITEHTEWKRDLSKALNLLDPLKKEAFLLRYRYDMSIREIAHITHCPEGTVKTRIFYALRELATLLRGHNPTLQPDGK
jgi:RNA polymerase sigma-70 factor (ECF subfamily)